jgi:hypothetical protein
MPYDKISSMLKNEIPFVHVELASQTFFFECVNNWFGRWVASSTNELLKKIKDAISVWPAGE